MQHLGGGSGNKQAMQDVMDTADAPRRKRIFVWTFEISAELIDELACAAIDVVAIGHGSYPGLSCFSIHDLFHGSPEIARLGLVPAPPEWLDAESFRRYSRCIQRIGFVPSNTRTDSFSGAIVAGYDLEDMARVHLSHAATVLQGLSIDEVWFVHPPHLAVDQMLALAAMHMRIRVIEFIQVPSVRKFRVRIDDGRRAVRWDQVPMKPWTQGAYAPDISYMKKPERRPMWRSLLRGTREVAVRLAADGWSSVAMTLHDWSARLERRNVIQRVLERRDPTLSPWVQSRTQMHRRFKENSAGIERLRDLDGIGDYIYFPLHLEPEMNVHILGGRFYNQLDAIQALLRVMPEGWTLLLKENPKQGYLHRGEGFYQRLRMLPRVRFVADELPSRRLIENCRLVATIVGTAGYEALLTGKPCIHFGDAWYAGLPGAFGFVDDINLETVAAVRPQKADLDRAMNDLLGRLPDGLAYPRYAKLFDPHELPETYRETARSMAAISAAVV